MTFFKIGDRVIRKYIAYNFEAGMTAIIETDFEGKVVAISESGDFIKVKPTRGLYKLFPATWEKKINIEKII